MLNQENIALYAFRKFGDTALQAAYCATGSREDAEDIAQEVFFALHRKPVQFESDAHLKAYILRAVMNRAKNLRKSLWSRKRTDVEDIADLPAEPDNSAEILALIAALPQPYSAAVYLHDCAGYKIREIAEMLDAKPNTVSAWLRRGHQRLRMELEPE